MSAGPGPGEASLLGLQSATLSRTFLCASVGVRKGALVSLPLLIGIPALLDQGPTLTTSFHLGYLLQGPIFK